MLAPRLRGLTVLKDTFCERAGSKFCLWDNPFFPLLRGGLNANGSKNHSLFYSSVTRITTISEIQPVLKGIAHPEIPEETIKVELSRTSMP